MAPPQDGPHKDVPQLRVAFSGHSQQEQAAEPQNNTEKGRRALERDHDQRKRDEPEKQHHLAVTSQE
jgi:hypothetical protein